MTIRVPLRARYNGGIAADGRLPLYDGTASIQGVAQAVQIATHALLTGSIVTRATAARSADFYLLPSRSGSYLVELAAYIEANPAVAGISAPIIYDWIKTIFTKATSRRQVEPTTAKVDRWMERDEPFLDELAETLEGSLQRVHRPIGPDVTTITFERPRAELLTLNADTKAWVNTRDVTADATAFTGNVTRFNSITRNGRAFIDQLRRVVPFKPADDFAMGGLQYLTWSLHGSANDLPKRLRINAREVKSATEETKRLLLVDCARDE
ncbi:DUF7946 domain-containing protein [Sphingomonas melonis]|uniref:DUF7946 domain-containing protein n=1 Tax=Sphingomonas melonis TaxID=152682 RepID=A0A7Y9K1W0_9SPHN|nr:hypothetical protein [Sphingomonas melonis]NYD91413.1 hypothetical protein [Sphingomonas melonis]